jgi:hypothetical protein
VGGPSDDRKRNSHPALPAKRRRAVLFSEKIMLIPPNPIALLAIDKSVY